MAKLRQFSPSFCCVVKRVAALDEKYKQRVSDMAYTSSSSGGTGDIHGEYTWPCAHTVASPAAERALAPVVLLRGEFGVGHGRNC